MKNQKLQISKAGKLFNVRKYPGYPRLYNIEINEGIEFLVGNSEKKFESYLRKSFRHFYNLDKQLKTSNIKGRLSINKS